MKLVHKEIPDEFLTSIPDGIKYIRKHGKDFLVIEKILCPNGHNIIVDTVQIHGESSLHLHIKVGKTEGSVFIDAFWGRHAKLYSFIPDVSAGNFAVEASCPVCMKNMIIEEECIHKECDSNKAIVFNLPGDNNKIFVCSKLGCPGHRMHIIDLPVSVAEEVSHINFFGAQADDILMEL